MDLFSPYGCMPTRLISTCNLSLQLTAFTLGARRYSSAIHDASTRLWEELCLDLFPCIEQLELHPPSNSHGAIRANVTTRPLSPKSRINGAPQQQFELATDIHPLAAHLAPLRCACCAIRPTCSSAPSNSFASVPIARPARPASPPHRHSAIGRLAGRAATQPPQDLHTLFPGAQSYLPGLPRPAGCCIATSCVRTCTRKHRPAGRSGRRSLPLTRPTHRHQMTGGSVGCGPLANHQPQAARCAQRQPVPELDRAEPSTPEPPSRLGLGRE